MRGRVLYLVALAVAVAGASTALAERGQRTAALHLLDVGQGDAILLRSGGTDVLVDGGPDGTVLQRLGELRPPWDRRIEVLVLTHPQQDHLAGLLPLLEREEVGLLLLPPVRAESDLFRAFVEEVALRRIPVRFARPGQQVRADGITLRVLAPGAEALALARANMNNGSIVLRADMEDSRLSTPNSRLAMLLTGDIERGAEHLLVQDAASDLDVDVLKVPHHGSKTSTSLRLLRATTPALALVSAGEGNRYGHPHGSVLRRLVPLAVLRTDRQGTVSLRVEGGRVTIACAKRGSCPAGGASLR